MPTGGELLIRALRDAEGAEEVGRVRAAAGGPRGGRDRKGPGPGP